MMFVDGHKSWFEAKMDCKTRGGDLVTIDSDTKLQTVKQLRKIFCE